MPFHIPEINRALYEKYFISKSQEEQTEDYKSIFANTGFDLSHVDLLEQNWKIISPELYKMFHSGVQKLWDTLMQPAALESIENKL